MWNILRNGSKVKYSVNKNYRQQKRSIKNPITSICANANGNWISAENQARKFHS